MGLGRLPPAAVFGQGRPPSGPRDGGPVPGHMARGSCVEGRAGCPRRPGTGGALPAPGATQSAALSLGTLMDVTRVAAEAIGNAAAVFRVIALFSWPGEVEQEP